MPFQRDLRFRPSSASGGSIRNIGRTRREIRSPPDRQGRGSDQERVSRSVAHANRAWARRRPRDPPCDQRFGRNPRCGGSPRRSLSWRSRRRRHRQLPLQRETGPVRDGAQSSRFPGAKNGRWPQMGGDVVCSRPHPSRWCRQSVHNPGRVQPIGRTVMPNQHSVSDRSREMRFAPVSKASSLPAAWIDARARSETRKIEHDAKSPASVVSIRPEGAAFRAMAISFENMSTFLFQSTFICKYGLIRDRFQLSGSIVIAA